ncbi:hypothetical protein [Streptomyces sp. MZ04]|nr:hypothetical protein [Streptomyces sp. MZ04]
MIRVLIVDVESQARACLRTELEAVKDITVVGEVADTSQAADAVSKH